MFLIFGGQTHYAGGGGNDLLGLEKDRDAAIAFSEFAIDKMAVTEDTDPDLGMVIDHEIEWSHVVDGNTGAIVFKAGDKPYGVDRPAIRVQ